MRRRHDEGGGDDNPDAAGRLGVFAAPNEMIDHLADEGGEVDIKRGRQVVEVVIDDGIIVPQDHLEIALGSQTGLAHGAKKSSAKMIHRNVKPGGAGGGLGKPTCQLLAFFVRWRVVEIANPGLCLAEDV